MKVSARNQFSGSVTKVSKGAMHGEVTLKLSGSSTDSAVVTNEAVADLQLAAGKSAVVLIEASHVIIGVA